MSAYDTRARAMGRRKRLSYKHGNHGRTESHWCGNLECRPSFALSRGFVCSAAIIAPKNASLDHTVSAAEQRKRHSQWASDRWAVTETSEAVTIIRPETLERWHRDRSRVAGRGTRRLYGVVVTMLQ
jgi:hypothetical protein